MGEPTRGTLKVSVYVVIMVINNNHRSVGMHAKKFFTLIAVQWGIRSFEQEKKK